ncbi:MAG: hypothetical protein Kow0042_25980 [Calditrichia bacterium]
MKSFLFKVVPIFVILGLGTSIFGQIRVAVAEFQNESREFNLDSWEQSVPDLLQSKLSQSKSLIVLERRKLQAVLEEKALSLAGLTDSGQVQEIGTLLNAEYLITGSIHKVNQRYRIDASIIKVKTGVTRTEKVDSPDREHLPKMIDLLANNILNQLTGSGKYKNRLKLKQHPTKYFLLGTVGLALATGLVRSNYEKKLEEYHNNTQLDLFDELYKKANNRQKLSVALGTLTGAALVGTIYCWIRNLSPKEILANSHTPPKPIPYLATNFNNNIQVGLWFRF